MSVRAGVVRVSDNSKLEVPSDSDLDGPAVLETFIAFNDPWDKLRTGTFIEVAVDTDQDKAVGVVESQREVLADDSRTLVENNVGFGVPASTETLGMPVYLCQVYGEAGLVLEAGTASLSGYYLPPSPTFTLPPSTRLPSL
jgi:hypothetical protein